MSVRLVNRGLSHLRFNCYRKVIEFLGTPFSHDVVCEAGVCFLGHCSQEHKLHCSPVEATYHFM